MTELPKKYAWLANETAPRMLIEALKLFGVAERLPIGDRTYKDNPEVLSWAKELGLDGVYKRTETPWCGLFAAIIAKRAGKPIPKTPLWARDWAKWGTSTRPELGCILVFARGQVSGHVGLYVGEDADCYHVLGGNQRDSVCITRIPKSRILASRCAYRAKPDSVRPVNLAPSGAVSENEA
jgi:uncharacterized protein (TIGR02594 family)